MSSLSEQIANAALTRFASLAQKCKPRNHTDGSREWTPLAAIVVIREHQQDIVECVALATGTKCVPASVLDKCHGTVLHDSHAEVLALRGFNRWLLGEVERLLRDDGYISPYLGRSVRVREDDVEESQRGDPVSKPFGLRDDIQLHMFTTEAPCGDASMEILMKSRPAEDNLPWTLNPATDDTSCETAMLGRGHFTQLGLVRRKPARGDADVSLSKSCTDKLAMKQFTGLLSFPADTLIEVNDSAFLKSLVVYANQYDKVGYQRAFGTAGHLSAARSDRTRSFEIEPLPTPFPPFEYSKVAGTKTSNISALWVRQPTGQEDILETLLNGVKQGFKQFDSRRGKESAVCRKQMWLLGARLMSTVYGSDDSGLVTRSISYADAKGTAARDERRKVKATVIDVLKGWYPNIGDGSWHNADP